MGSNYHKIDLTDLVGQKIRMLTVVSFSHIEKAEHTGRIRNKYMYLCKCDCGNETLVNRFHLKQKDSASATWSCGCYQKQQSLIGHKKQRGVPRPHVQKPNGESILNTQLSHYKRGAEERNLIFALTDKDFENLTKQNCYYCDAPPRVLKKKDCFTTRAMNGVDRLDSTEGYLIKNCVACCKTCNYMKNELSVESFLNHIGKILAYQSKKQQEVYLLTGAPGAGKSWILSQVNHFDCIDSDKVSKKHLKEKIIQAKRPLLALTIGISTFITNNPQFKVKLLVIKEELATLKQRLLLRNGKITETLIKRAERMEKLAKRAEFSGSSEEVLKYINELK